jgi:hypothetical protein
MAYATRPVKSLRRNLFTRLGKQLGLSIAHATDRKRRGQMIHQSAK